jgi:hypothetical protein
MIKANFSAYASYVTDSLYQWDINQVLSVSGLNVSTAPEVHFSNANMDKAIVKQSTLNNHVVNVKIPNSLLQDPLTIHAHIGIYEGDTFKVIERVEIPIIPRKRPADYKIETTDEEIYSFEALKNMLANKADDSRVDNIIAHNNDTDGNTELIDIRTDINGKIHGNAGTAIRVQVGRSLTYRTDSVMNLNDIMNCGMYFIGSSGADNLPDGATSGMLLVYYGEQTTRLYQEYKDYSNGMTYTRHYKKSAWTAWEQLALMSDVNKELSDLSKISLAVRSDPTDVNLVTDTGIYFISSLNGVLNLPDSEKAGLLLVYYGDSWARIYQEFRSFDTGKTYTRHSINKSVEFSAWKELSFSDEITKKPFLIRKTSDESFTVYRLGKNGAIAHKYFRHILESKNLDTWRMGAISLCDSALNVVKEISSDDYDQEGVLKIANESDYLGGIHGDEQFTNMWLFVDGKPMDLSEMSENIYCDEVKVIVASNITHADTTNVCMTKTKQTIFDSTGIHVNNCWKMLEALEIERVRGILLSVNKDCIKYYYDSTVNTTPMIVPESNGSITDDKMVDTFYSGDISARVWCGLRGGDTNGYGATISDFGDRLKSYFDCYKNHVVNIGDELYCQNNFIITC